MPAELKTADQRKMIFLFCLLAAIHVFIFSATFPFFNVVDEHQHFDLVLRYSHLDVPRALVPINKEAMPFIAVYSTQEYLWSSEMLPERKFSAPLWKLPFDVAAKNLHMREVDWSKTITDHEASQPPLYYFLAGAWWRAGNFFGLDGLSLLVWLRCLNIVFVCTLIWLGWFAARKIFPENIFVQVAVPAIIAFMPQTAFYSINNDVLSPVTFGIVFVLLLQFWQSEKLSQSLAVGIGLALAATFLTKTGNLLLLAIAGIFLLVKIFQLARAKKIRPSIFSLFILVVCAALPMAGWMAWCKNNFGDFTGSDLKIQYLHWTHKPFAEWFHHPLFSPSGFWFFVKGNFSTFWQGEFLWHRQPLAIPVLNYFYVALTLFLLAVTLFALLRRPPQFTSLQRAGLWFGFACLASAFAFFALLSVKYDFQTCFYPSREHPFFISGRLMLGLLIPFLILFVCGLDHLMKKFPTSQKFIVLAFFLIFMLAAEIATDWQIFPNDYNWFHR